jgi:hypothetical protein
VFQPGGPGSRWGLGRCFRWGEGAVEGGCPAAGGGGGHWLLLVVTALASGSNGRQGGLCRIGMVSVGAIRPIRSPGVGVQSSY